MIAITYNNTLTTLPNRRDSIHSICPKGYAYETDTHFVHLYGYNDKFYSIHVGMTVLEKKSGTLSDWVIRTFGAEDIQTLDLDVGHSIDGVWRPSLYYYADSWQALNCSDIEMRLAEQSLRVLIGKLDELFLYIEPDNQCLQTYSHKTRELLILACTEVENSWKSYMTKASAPPINGRAYTTKDYVKLLNKLHLGEYAFKLRSFQSVPSITPFKTWNTISPSTSLSWYDAYNKTKHDRTANFAQATLWNCICAVVANLVLHCVKFSPYPMFEETTMFSTLVKDHFQGELVAPSLPTFYIHKFTLPANTRNDLFIFDAREYGYAEPFTTLPFVL